MEIFHTLYSYRRCPYAMRARMALMTAQIQCHVYDINFRNKPAAMLAASPKGTVPVLITSDNQVIDESLDIMLWALKVNDPQDWISKQPEKQITNRHVKQLTRLNKNRPATQTKTFDRSNTPFLVCSC